MLVVARAILAPVLKRPSAREDCRERVIIRGQDRIELVVVTASAGYGQAQKRLCRRVDLLVDDVVFLLNRVTLGESHRPERKESGRDDSALVDGRRFRRWKQVSCDLLPHELIEREIVVECIDNVVAIAPRIAERVILVDAGGIGIPSHIQPVAPPALAVMRRA